MSIFKSFKTDQSLESDGVLIDYQDFRLRLRRSGGSNKLYTKAIEKGMKPWRNKDIDKEDVSVRRALWLEIFMTACYVEHSWETKVGTEFVKGIENESGEIVAATKQNVQAILELLPDLASALQSEASNIDHYLAAATAKAADALKD